VKVFAIDPGTRESGLVLYDPEKRTVEKADIVQNEILLADIRNSVLWAQGYFLAIEMVASYGMPVGADVFETVRWIGRLQEAWGAINPFMLCYRKDIKIHLCGTSKAKDGNIRQRLLDIVGEQGTKKEPGPTYGVRSHAWSALAVAVYATDNLPKFDK
jgi:hypothetical protein